MAFVPSSALHLTLAKPVYLNLATLRDSILAGDTVEPGMYIGLYGEHWPSPNMSRYEVQWTGPDTVVSAAVLSASDNRAVPEAMRGVVCIVPPLKSGTYTIGVLDRRAHTLTNTVTLDITGSASPAIPSVRDSILSVLNQVDSAFGALASAPIIAEQFQGVLALVADVRTAYQQEADSLATVPENELDLVRLGTLWSFLSNTRAREAVGGSVGVVQSSGLSCDDECANDAAKCGIVCTALCGAFGAFGGGQPRRALWRVQKFAGNGG